MHHAPPPNRSTLIAVGVLFCCASAAWFYFLDPSTTDAFLPCPFYSITGLQCPGCGTQHAVHSLLHGNAREALRWNPLIVLILPLFLLAAFQWYIRDILRYRVRVVHFPTPIVIILFVVIIAFWIVRNLPGG